MAIVSGDQPLRSNTNSTEFYTCFKRNPFESWPEYRLHYLMCLLVFLSTSRYMPVYYLKLVMITCSLILSIHHSPIVLPFHAEHCLYISINKHRNCFYLGGSVCQHILQYIANLVHQCKRLIDKNTKTLKPLCHSCMLENTGSFKV
jgi:hypothetical protein